MSHRREPDSVTYETITQRNYGVLSSHQQDMLRSAKVVIVGIGCDGGLVAMILARMGVGTLTLVDFDVIEPSNLNRQPLCTMSGIGRKKIDVASEILQDCNPFVSIRTLDERLTEANGALLQGHDVAVQCIDNFAGRVALHRASQRLGIPTVSMTGQPPYRAMVSTFLPRSPAYEIVMGLPSLGKALSTETTAQLESLKAERARNAAMHGATPGWCEDYISLRPGWGGAPVGWGITPERAYLTATIQAHETVRVITGRPPLAEAPKAAVIDLSTPPVIIEVRTPPDGLHWKFRHF